MNIRVKKILKWSKRIILYPLIIIFLGFVIVLTITHMVIKPSNDRDWATDQSTLSYGDIHDNLITVHNVRNFTYTSKSDYASGYYDKTFDLNKIKKVYYIVEPFAGIPGSAHAFLSFEFEDDQFVAISVEIRKEKGETYNPIKGLLNQYELMYVIADEQDAIKLRSNYRKDLVYVYPAKTTKERMQKLFLDMIERANYLKDHPEFYHTLTNTCTTNIVRHINTIIPGRVPLFRLQILLPRDSDRLAYELGLIDTDLSFEDARDRYFINDRAIKYADSSDFSIKIRGSE
ncbi:MAG: hypothetical protein COZ49_03710 [Candidatus Yonathbacteria bacterium CG_4_10_14_3_um_filter_47_65]|uniref:Lnb N-terminal periplasmic domain-containing protein n=2 Tax=Parcubacteria group TaxID=1794811 RepID=A0A2M8D7A8_9BACT|nr:MAG: hypothetical protein COX54_00675 [Candidatus Yonathbacteria bacterium CG23_combo_of_CG06-09_8_20_14_all_46_18]PIQ31025.1 MAG: hypothetical protein COW61_04440 [Candidatus Yonathbacteria bacterium CG17_big_fil_post_rev_8_21_14_2_50_46_19]PIX56137.1 MAG: hypothetical protein COZ49_03710 [Candidatus Yonathbacteria bacterium CG_4_10_14_3_um_filter_47_65]PIY57297.1 MAG: hypothetical protein COY99_03965 [Candidatus Yonathbacteria bacterium CG_4_10_14_0_8_um_filter_47_645]PJB83041.1 MAG: hypot